MGDTYRAEAASGTTMVWCHSNLETGVPPLDLATLKDFVRYKVSVSQGIIDDKGRPTADSMNTFEEWFFAGFARITGNTYTEEDRQELYKVFIYECKLQ